MSQVLQMSRRSPAQRFPVLMLLVLRNTQLFHHSSWQFTLECIFVLSCSFVFGVHTNTMFERWCSCLAPHLCFCIAHCIYAYMHICSHLMATRSLLGPSIVEGFPLLLDRNKQSRNPGKDAILLLRIQQIPISVTELVRVPTEAQLSIRTFAHNGVL